MTHERPRVLMLAPQPFFAVRGTPMNVLRMCRALTRAGYDVDLVAYPIGDPIELPGLTIHRAPRVPAIRSVPIGFSLRKVLLDISLAYRLLTLLPRRRYALVHAIEESVFAALPVAAFDIPLIYDLDSCLSDQLQYSGAVRSRWVLALVHGLEKLAIARASACITVSHSLTREVKRTWPEARVFQIEDAPLEDTERPADPADVARLRSELELEGRSVVLYTGNLEAYQGIDLLLEAAPKLIAQAPNAVIVIVGGADRAITELRARVEALGLRSNVLAVGARPPSEMSTWMELADVLVSPRITGGNTPLKIYTYMWSGRPIVATDLETHTQVLDDSTAILCEPTPSALAAGLLRGLRGGGDASALGLRARVRVEACYSGTAFDSKLRAAYAAVLGREPEARGNPAPKPRETNTATTASRASDSSGSHSRC